MEGKRVTENNRDTKELGPIATGAKGADKMESEVLLANYCKTAFEQKGDEEEEEEAVRRGCLHSGMAG